MPLKMQWLTMAVVTTLVVPPVSFASKPLHQRIDAIIDAARQGPAAKICSDGEFVRRVHLDLVGTIPTAEAARQFIDDAAEDKRAALIDQLLSDERFPHHLQTVFDAMLMERRPEKHIKVATWRQYLVDSFRENKPLNQLAREILRADAVDDRPPPAARFYLDREVQPHLITRDVARLMLGRDLQCAQCHDHPSIVNYEQSEYYGIFAFVNRSYLFTSKDKKTVMLGEKAEGDVSYESVFDKGTKYHTGPQLLGREPIEEPQLGEEERYEVKPAKDVYGVPAFSLRKELAERMTAGDYIPFNRNMANRLWAVMFGRGIVHPLDLHHADNPPVHPELLRLLAEELAASKFDLRTMLGEIARSDTYQRGCRMPDVSDKQRQVLSKQFFVYGLRPLSPEQMTMSLYQAVGDLPARLKSAKEAELAKAEKESREVSAGEVARLAHQAVYDQLQGATTELVAVFNQTDGQPTEEFEGRATEALYLANGPRMKGLVGGRLAARLTALEQPAEVAEQLYLAVLSRRPEPPEIKMVAEFLNGPNIDRRSAMEEMIWGLLASTEFRFNH